MTHPTLVLVRHGNTFEKGQKTFWVGARTDLPLTLEGEEQARQARAFIAENYAPVSSIVAGPLKRTTRTAVLMSETFGVDVTVDQRLCEIDYGKWEGLDNSEIAARFSKTELDAWNDNSVWPDDMEWSPGHEELRRALHAFLDEQLACFAGGAAQTRVAVTSNGLLRVLYDLIGGADPSLCKVRTGGICALTPCGLGWEIEAWNVKP